MNYYLALQIEEGALDYLEVVTKFPKRKSSIDGYLIADGYEYLIVNTEDNDIEINGEKITINNECISIAA